MSNQKDDDNGSFIPASQRPDGTWRKARRVKEGYVPQEEVPLYESKGKKFLNKQTKAEPVRVNGYTAHRSIPGLFIQDPPPATTTTTTTSKKEKKKPATSTNEVTKDMNKLSIKTEECDGGSGDAGVDAAKKLKNLRKRLREVEALEVKIRSGKLEKPEPDQLTKVNRKADLILQITELEKLVE